MPTTAIVFTGGDDPGPAAVQALPADRVVIAADSGLDHADRLGVRVDIAVGDFDSVDPVLLAKARGAGVRIDQHPSAKDQTDLELAMHAALGTGADHAIVVGGHGGRADHWLGNVAIWASPSYARMRIEVRSGASRLFVVRDHVRVSGAVGDYVSLLPWNGPAEGVRTTGLRWQLSGDRLEPGSSRGVSNELTATTATVEVEDGVLLVVLPGEHAPSSEGVGAGDRRRRA